MQDIYRTGRIIVAARSGRLLGTIGMVRSASPWNIEAEYYQSAFLYVPAAHRRTGVSHSLSTAAISTG